MYGTTPGGPGVAVAAGGKYDTTPGGAVAVVTVGGIYGTTPGGPGVAVAAGGKYDTTPGGAVAAGGMYGTTPGGSVMVGGMYCTTAGASVAAVTVLGGCGTGRGNAAATTTGPGAVPMLTACWPGGRKTCAWSACSMGYSLPSSPPSGSAVSVSFAFLARAHAFAASSAVAK